MPLVCVGTNYVGCVMLSLGWVAARTCIVQHSVAFVAVLVGPLACFGLTGPSVHCWSFSRASFLGWLVCHSQVVLMVLLHWLAGFWSVLSGLSGLPLENAC